MLRFGVYPLAWGFGLVRAILKPASSLRGIRLLSSFASWFGRVFDNRARKVWGPGPEQFGFRAGMGCSEAVILLVGICREFPANCRILDDCFSRVHVLALAPSLPSAAQLVAVCRLSG